MAAILARYSQNHGTSNKQPQEEIKMNTERLFTITKQLKNEIVEMKLVKTLNSLHDQLQTAINSPSVDHQRAVETTLNNLHQSLTQAPSNKFSPGFLLNIKTLRVSNRTTVSDLFGKGLSEKLRIFSRMAIRQFRLWIGSQILDKTLQPFCLDWKGLRVDLMR